MNRLPASDPHEQWWMGTPRAEGGLVIWKGNNCDEVFATNQGQPKPASAKFAFKCCKGTKPPAAGLRLQSVAPRGWACTSSGDVCAQKKINKAGGMDWEAVKVCGKLQAHVCTYADTVALCGARVNPFEGAKRGWLGDVGRASKVKFKFGSFFTWKGDACGSSNIGTVAPSSTSLGFRCCRGAQRPCGGGGGGKPQVCRVRDIVAACKGDTDPNAIGCASHCGKKVLACRHSLKNFDRSLARALAIIVKKCSGAH